MKKIVLYRCEICGYYSDEDESKVLKHEAEHLGLTVEEYEKWRELVMKVRVYHYLHDTTADVELQAVNEAEAELEKFETEYGLR